jgi:hypothetical protein
MSIGPMARDKRRVVPPVLAAHAGTVDRVRTPAAPRRAGYLLLGAAGLVALATVLRRGVGDAGTASAAPVAAPAPVTDEAPLADEAPAAEFPIWEFPKPFGRAAAVDTMSGIAAPLLAGFSITLLGVVAQAPTSFRWPAATLLGLALVAVFFVIAVQTGFRARSFLYSKADIDAWWPERRADWLERSLQRQQQAHYNDWVWWHGKTRIAYNAAVVTLAIAISMVLAPPRSYGAGTALSATETDLRWAGSAVAVLAALCEVGWVLGDVIKERREVRRYAAATDSD